MAFAATFPAAGVTRPRVAQRRPSTTRSRLVLTRRGRVVLGLTLGVLVLAILTVSGRFSADAGTAALGHGRVTGVVVVQPGESLWQIAKAVAPGTDPRATVTEIRALNALGDGPVVPGQSLVVPLHG
jgi:hypothetical protein